MSAETFFVQYSNFLNAGALIQVSTTTSNVMQPPKMTEGAVPSNVAATPLSNWPSSLDELTNIELTLETLPRMLSGTNNCTTVPLIITLTPSNSPLANKAAKLNQKFLDKANINMQSPKPATTYKSVLPCCFFSGREVSQAIATKFPR